MAQNDYPAMLRLYSELGKFFGSGTVHTDREVQMATDLGMLRAARDAAFKAIEVRDIETAFKVLKKVKNV